MSSKGVTIEVFYTQTNVKDSLPILEYIFSALISVLDANDIGHSDFVTGDRTVPIPHGLALHAKRTGKAGS